MIGEAEQVPDVESTELATDSMLSMRWSPRRGCQGSANSAVTFTLHPRPPFRLDLTVDGVVHHLGPGDELTVDDVGHRPVNPSASTTVITVACRPGTAAERGLRGTFGLARDGRIRADSRPGDILSLALLSEKGQFRIDGVPPAIWRPLIAGLALTARIARRRRVVEQYWAPDLQRPW